MPSLLVLEIQNSREKHDWLDISMETQQHTLEHTCHDLCCINYDTRHFWILQCLWGGITKREL